MRNLAEVHERELEKKKKKKENLDEKKQRKKVCLGGVKLNLCGRGYTFADMNGLPTDYLNDGQFINLIDGQFHLGFSPHSGGKREDCARGAKSGEEDGKGEEETRVRRAEDPGAEAGREYRPHGRQERHG